MKTWKLIPPVDYNFGVTLFSKVEDPGSHFYLAGLTMSDPLGGDETVPLRKELLPSNEKFWEKALIRSKVQTAGGDVVVGGFGHLELDPATTCLTKMGNL